MTYPHGGAGMIWRDAGAHNPVKAEIRDWGYDVQNRINGLEDQAFAADPIYPDVASGLAATAIAAQFKVDSADPLIAFTVYEHAGDGTATLIADMPAGSALSNIDQAITDEADARRAATADGGVLRLTNIAGSADAATADLAAGVADISLVPGMLVFYVPISTNT
ncbi:MAG: hypothetical protein H5U19_07735, partial [Rhodobacteraceae bacterium]|nr:hypothetical protein [Paracoccaceae bacterium]